MHLVQQNHKKQNSQGVPRRGTSWKVLIFRDSLEKVKVIPRGFTRELAFFKGLIGDFTSNSRVGCKLTE